ncbi:MAG TPA: type II secretion system F family protein [Thermoplasmataceae archaeon]|nr:type II secretion system F family protein [Thermoplasmatales archaeon AK]HLH85921.1 type II secretion system F family protein [Thermoplasmataceae archaeon]
MFKIEIFGNRKDVDVIRIPWWRSVSHSLFSVFYQDHFKNQKMDVLLRKASIPYTRAEYYSQVTLLMIVVSAALITADAFTIVLYRSFSFLVSGILFLVAVVVFALFLEQPEILARRRKRNIDSMLTVAIGFFATLASSEIPIDRIMFELGKNRLYGEISTEARVIWYRAKLFGQDILTSIRESIRYSPSEKFADLLQGIVTSVNSGGNIKEYFRQKARSIQEETRTAIRHNSDSLGILAESFVTVGVAFPLILLMIVGVVSYLSPSSPVLLILFIFIIAILMIPAIIIAFGLLFYSSAGEIEL